MASESEARAAIDRLAKRIRQHTNDPNLTQTKARERAQKIADRVDRKYQNNP